MTISLDVKRLKRTLFQEGRTNVILPPSGLLAALRTIGYENSDKPAEPRERAKIFADFYGSKPLPFREGFWRTRKYLIIQPVGNNYKITVDS